MQTVIDPSLWKDNLRTLVKLSIGASRRERIRIGKSLAEVPLRWIPNDLLDGVLSIVTLPEVQDALVELPPRVGGWGRLRKELIVEYGQACAYCGQSGDMERGPDGRTWHIDHAYPRSRGGGDERSNLVLACSTCNLSKSGKLGWVARRA
jgi:hypothetical protein